MRILVTGANGQVGQELLRALAVESASPSVPLPAEGGGRTLGAVAVHPLPREEDRASAPSVPLPAEGEGRTLGAVAVHPLPWEENRASAPSVPLPAEGGGQTLGAVAVHPLPREEDRASAPPVPLPAEWGGRTQGAVAVHPLPREGGRASARGDAGAHREIIPATRDGTLEGAAFFDQARLAACERIDLADVDDISDALDRIAPDLIVHAAAYTAVDRAEDEQELAMRVNADAVGALGAWAARHAARVVHYSTDYIFDGSATRPYLEGDATHPLDVYGRTKLAGERALRESGARHLILRTAWVYGARGHNFLRTMLRLAGERDELRVVDDQVGAPTSAGLIADVTARVVACWFGPGDGSDARTLDGTYHLVAAGQTSWCGFARAIFARAAHAGLLERVPQVRAIRTADYPTRARRPSYSVLDTGKLRNTFHIDLPDWQTALDGVIGELARS